MVRIYFGTHSPGWAEQGAGVQGKTNWKTGLVPRGWGLWRPWVWSCNWKVTPAHPWETLGLVTCRYSAWIRITTTWWTLILKLRYNQTLCQTSTSNYREMFPVCVFYPKMWSQPESIHIPVTWLMTGMGEIFSDFYPCVPNDEYTSFLENRIFKEVWWKDA